MEIASSASQYEVLARLATGGMAEIYLARGIGAAGVERYVVLKRIRRERAADDAMIQMFLDEARLAAQLNHPNIAQVIDVGTLDDSYFFTMEYVHGETVSAMLRRCGELGRQLPIATVLTIAAGASTGLHHAHARKDRNGQALGIVHRDVSPSNLMVSYEGAVKVVDFGVAKATERPNETKSGTIKGKIGYLSPEQAKGLPLDRRSDLFSLGIVIWEMLVGERLFRRSGDFETMQAIVSEPTPPPSTRRGDVPPALDRLVGRLLEKDPSARFQTAFELHDAIEEVAVACGVALSVSSTSRVMRELFGERPEPWHALGNADDASVSPNVQSSTVATASHAANASIDQALSAVVDLGKAKLARPTVPLRVRSAVNPSSVTVMLTATPLWAPAPAQGEPPPALPASHPVVESPRGATETELVTSRRQGWRLSLIVATAIVLSALAGVWLSGRGKEPSATERRALAVSADGSGSPPSPLTTDAAAMTAPADTAVASTGSGSGTAPPSVPRPADALASALEAQRDDVAIDLCKAHAELVATDVEACVLAACRAHATDLARAWYRKARSGRTALQARCRAAGTNIAPRARSSRCAADPFACQD